VSCVFLKIIIYEGQDKNPEMCRVLLTHEIMCRSVDSRFISLTLNYHISIADQFSGLGKAVGRVYVRVCVSVSGQ